MKTDSLELINIIDCDSIRIVTKPYRYTYHKDMDSSYAFKPILCVASFATCPLCVSADVPQMGYLAGIINRADNKCYIMKFGFRYFTQLRNLVLECGDPTLFDIKITHENNQCKLLALTKSPMTDFDTKISKSITNDYLWKLCNPKQQDLTLLDKLAIIM